MNIFSILRSAFNKNRRRNVVAASIAALVVAAAVGTATAITLTIDIPRAYESLVEINIASSGSAELYTVPQGKKLMLTDLTFANPSTTTTLVVTVFQGNAGCGSLLKGKTILVVPSQNTLHIGSTTGIYFGPGAVCTSTSGSSTHYVTARGYLFQ